ncbi:hypothetical protein REA19_19980 [Prescottella equi]|nr:hypothetical protein REA19_19980 [Prescottella equi]
MNLVTWKELLATYPAVKEYAQEVRGLWQAQTHDWQSVPTFPTHIEVRGTWITLAEWVVKYA